MGSNFSCPQNTRGGALLGLSCSPAQTHSHVVLLDDAGPVTEERAGVPQGISNIIVLSVNNASEEAPEMHRRSFMIQETAK